MRKIISALITLLVTFVSLQTVQTPASAAVATETGDIYYWGAWDDAIQNFRGLHRYNLDTMTHFSPTAPPAKVSLVNLRHWL
jgi:hypothetical protein